MIFQLPGLVICVRKPELADLDCLTRWVSTEAYLNNIGGPGAHHAGQARLRAEQMLQDNADDHSPNKYFLAEDRFTREPVGLAMLCKIDWRHRHAEYTYLVGDEANRSKLAAGDLNMVMYNHCFNHLNLRKLYGYIFDTNAASLRMISYGGQLDGTLRRHRVRAGVASDVHLFSILDSEFAAFVNKHAATLLKKHIERGLINWRPGL
ncbi:GNAT family N-acetyltransferase [Massilia sp. TSP1-1-2]|uniref:GNAT family N-acetyltransferase n=1 Tax=Massilia sp. TSP1-1-2 TaxID=2804649 RepID=UPI003CEC3C22